MYQSKANSLFHFTESIEVLKSILQNGFRFSYSFEEHYMFDRHSNRTIEIIGGAIPMICFCDIPLTRTKDHVDLYGRYFIGLNKEFMQNAFDSFLNPVIYYNSPELLNSIWVLIESHNILCDIIDQRLKEIGIQYDVDIADLINNNELDELIDVETEQLASVLSKVSYSSRLLYGFLKPMFGINKKGEHQFFDIENEWRVVWPDNDADEYKLRKFYTTKAEFYNNKDELNEFLWNSDFGYLKIPKGLFNMITYIAVSNEDEVQELISFIMSSPMLFGFDVLDSDNELRINLISKITSFERIETDY